MFDCLVEHEHRLAVLDPHPVDRQFRKWVGYVRRQVALLAGVGVHRATSFEDKLHALVAKTALGGVRVAVRRHFNVAQVGGKTIRTNFMGQWRTRCVGNEVEKVLGGGAVATHRRQSRTEDVLVIVQKLAAQSLDAGRRECKERRGTLGQLRVDLRGNLFGVGPVRSNFSPDGFAAVPVIDPPRAVVGINGDSADAHRECDMAPRSRSAKLHKMYTRDYSRRAGL